MDDTQRIVKCGNLLLHTNGGFFKKRWPSKYLVLYDGSKSGIKRLELFDSEIKFKKQNPAKIIALVDCVRVVTCQRHKTTYTFEVRTNDQFYLLAAQSFQDMNDWVNCLRLVAFGWQPNGSAASQQTLSGGQQPITNSSASPLVISGGTTPAGNRRPITVALAGSDSTQTNRQLNNGGCDVLLDKRTEPGPKETRPKSPKPATLSSSPAPTTSPPRQPLTTASQAAVAAANALAKTRQRQPSLLGSCKPQPPTDSPFIGVTLDTVADDPRSVAKPAAIINPIGQLDTMTPTVRGQLIAASRPSQISARVNSMKQQHRVAGPPVTSTLDEEEENMLYCSIEDNPSEHNYRVKVIETELALRCQLKCYPLAGPNTVSQQYEQLSQLRQAVAGQPTFYQLIIGPQELTLLNDYATAVGYAAALKQQSQQQGLWSWPYQCIRRYGFDKDNCFMFEAGRKCTSGPGQFIVQTPKAHSIYRDVVKFVNELRSLTTTANLNQLQPFNQSQQPVSQSALITQIPVTWTPSLQQKEASLAGDSQPLQTRQHFFDNLVQRQMDATQSVSAVANNNNSKVGQPVKSRASPEPAKPNTTAAEGQRGDLKVPSSVSAEETDESGYEQGDESVDSSQSADRNRAHTNSANRRRPITSEPMSSASSTSSADGSPSVHPPLTRKVVANSVQANNKQTNKRLSEMNQPPASNLQKQQPNQSAFDLKQRQLLPPPVPKKPANVHQTAADRLIGLKMSSAVVRGDEQTVDDFESNLIRDVYSEITKLHAKFAVTSGSAEDLMSSGNSSHESSASDNPSSYLANEQELDEQEPESANDSTDSTRGQHEPMYTNLSNGPGASTKYCQTRPIRPVPIPDQSRITLDEQDLDEILKANKEIAGRLARTGAINTSSPFMSRQRLFRQQSAEDLAQSGFQHRNQQYYSQTGFDYMSSSNPAPPPTRAYALPLYPSSLNPIPEIGELSSNQTWQRCRTSSNRFMDKSPASDTSLSDQVVDDQLQTRHYLINDVQYAKISREI